MGTKTNPGPYDCYAHAEPDEPIFIIRGKDPVGSIVVAFWAALSKQLHNQSDEKMMEAAKTAREMRAWAISKGKEVLVQNARDLLATGSETFRAVRIMADVLEVLKG